jgi:uncharacterized membrane protein YqaE (UPF0057 family)
MVPKIGTDTFNPLFPNLTYSALLPFIEVARDSGICGADILTDISNLILCVLQLTIE